MFKKLEKQDLILVILALVAITTLFIIIRVQPINARPDAKYDDNLIVEMAYNIVHGKWLGEYNNITLVKGVAAPMFIAALYYLKIPFLLGQMIFYILAIITFILIINKKVKNRYVLFFTFLYLLFNPVMYSTEICRVYRDGIYTSLILFLTSSIIGIFLNRKEDCLKLIKYFALLGISFSATYLCREETIWIMPFVCLSTIITICFIIFDKTCKNKIKKVLLYLIPISIFIITTVTICSLNYRNYGVFQLNQYWSKEFKEAYGALTRIESDTKYDKVPITKDALAKAYKISPTFAELENYFKLTEFRWSRCGDGILFEIQGGWFHWALMNGADSLGYYSDAKTANEFYQRIADEINKACDEGKVKALPYKRVSNTCRFSINDILNIISKMPSTMIYQNNLKDLEFKVPEAFETNEVTKEELSKNFIEIANENISSEDTYTDKTDNLRLNIMGMIYKVYKTINPILFYLSLVMYLILVIEFLKNKKIYYEEFLILSGLFTLYLSRIFIITFTSELMWTNAINTMYMSSAYPLQFVFSVLSILWGTNALKKVIDNIKNKTV